MIYCIQYYITTAHCNMKKRLLDEYPTKSKKREIKKRPRMAVHGKSLTKPNPHAGKKLASK